MNTADLRDMKDEPTNNYQSSIDDKRFGLHQNLAAIAVITLLFHFGVVG